MKEQVLKSFTANIKSDSLSRLLDEIDRVIIQSLAESYEEQGHSLTGKLIADLNSEVELNQGEIIVDYITHKYGAYLNSGVKPSAIKSPYAPARIAGLIAYVNKRMGLQGKEAKSVAYAIATRHKQIGMTIKSAGEGSKWADNAAKNAELDLIPLFENLSEDFIVKNLTDVFKNFK